MKRQFFAIDLNHAIVYGVGDTKESCIKETLNYSDDLELLEIEEYLTEQNWNDYDPLKHIIEIDDEIITFKI